VDYLQLKEDLALNRNDLAAQQKTVQQARAAVTEAERAAEQVQRDRVTDIYNDLDQRVTNEAALKGDFDKSRELYALKWLRAPVSGRVQKVNVTTVGQVVTGAQSLVTIVPDDTPLIVEATVSNEDIGYLKVGQPVEVKVDTFPFQKYGSLKATLVSISPDAEDRNAASRDTATRSERAHRVIRPGPRPTIQTPVTSTKFISGRISRSSSLMAMRAPCRRE
jgi:hemolysin D